MTTAASGRINTITCPETGKEIDVSDLSPEEALFTAFAVYTPPDQYLGSAPWSCLIPWTVTALGLNSRRSVFDTMIHFLHESSGVEEQSLRNIYSGVVGTEDDVRYGLAVAASNLDIPIDRANEVLKRHGIPYELRDDQYANDACMTDFYNLKYSAVYVGDYEEKDHD